MRPPTWRRSLSSAACHSGGGLDGAFKGHPLRVDEHTSHPLQTDPSLLGTPASPPSCRARGQSEDPGGSHLPGFQPFPSRNTRPSPPCWLRCPSCREDEVASVLASVGVLAWAPLLCKLGVPRPDGWPVASAQTHVPSHPPPRPTPPPVPAEPRAHPRVCSPACWAPRFADHSLFTPSPPSSPQKAAMPSCLLPMRFLGHWFTPAFFLSLVHFLHVGHHLFLSPGASWLPCAQLPLWRLLLHPAARPGRGRDPLPSGCPKLMRWTPTSYSARTRLAALNPLGHRLNLSKQHLTPPPASHQPWSPHSVTSYVPL